MSVFLTAFGFGMVTAGIIALAAVGLSLQISVTNVPNFAHGELLTFGAYGALVAQFVTNNLFVDAAAGMVAAGLVAFAMNRFVLQSFIRIGTRRIYLLIVTAGISLFLQNGLAVVFGQPDRVLALPSDASKPYDVGPFIWTKIDMLVMAAAVVSMGGLYLLLQHTKFGRAQRAVSDSADLARVSGVPVKRVVNLTWLIVGCLAGLAGFAIAITSGTVTPEMGSTVLLVVFAAAILGGIGRPYGALVAAVIIGIATEVSAAYIDASYKQIIAVAILVIAILFRPNGLFSSARETW
jgi:branched-subunit amino acid ABC-type transport system permease component